MEFYGYHGVYEEENKLGQRYRVSVELYLDLKAAGVTDDLDKSVNYAEIYSICKDVLEGKPYNLLEAVAEKLSAEILGSYSIIQSCKLKVVKPDPPIPGHYDYVAVEIIREQERA